MVALAPGVLSDVPLAQLRLDVENPRLPAVLAASDPTQQELLDHIARAYNLIELARSIADKGFHPRAVEALLVISTPGEPGVYTVVEGNRRLSTVMLLTDPEARARLELRAEWAQLAEEAARHDLHTLPVVLHEARSELDDYLGFRHITRPQEWRPEAKARFIVKLMRSGADTRAVARRIGSTRPTVRRYAEAFSVLRQAAAAELPVEEAEAEFGTFYNAIQVPGIRKYIGLPSAHEFDTYREDLIPEGGLQRIGDVLRFVFDISREQPKVIRESRDLQTLGEVLLDDRATNVLLAERDLRRAYSVAGGARRDVITSLDQARLSLADANGVAHEVTMDDEVRTAFSRVSRLVSEIARALGLDPRGNA